MNLPFLSGLVAAFVPMAVLLLFLTLDRRNRIKIEKPPQSEKLLRPPGHSLARELESVEEQIMDSLLFACGFGAIAGTCASALPLFLASGNRSLYAWLALTLFMLASVASTVMIVIGYRRIGRARNVRLGLRGEQAVAETLHEAAEHGFRTFHDFPGGDNWNIDHITVGTGGIFLIETKARRCKRLRNGKPDHVVVYDGQALHFPKGKDVKAVAQAERNARWLEEYLTKRTAEPVTFEPLLVLPGWYVETRGNFPVKAMNATYLAGFLRGQRERIPLSQVKRIRALIDEKCRDVEF